MTTPTFDAFCPYCGRPLIGHPTACPKQPGPRLNKYARGFSGSLFWTVRDLIEHDRWRAAWKAANT